MKTDLTLYEWTREYLEVIELVALEGGELSEELEARLDAIEDGIESKVERVAAVIRNFAAVRKALKEEASRLTARAKALEGNERRLRRYLLDTLVSVGRDKVKADTATVYLGTSTSLELSLDPADLPHEYRRVTVNPDKAAIKAALEAGGELEGAALVINQTLNIR